MNNIKTTPFDQKAYEQKLHQFDQSITFDQYQGTTIESVRDDIISKNKILKTDTYNRTMTHTFGDKTYESGVFTLSCRKSPNGQYNVIAGIRRRIKDLFTVPVTQNELDFAEAFYNEMKTQGWNGHFDKALRQSVLDKFDGYLPIDVYAVEDGTIQTPKEPSLRVESTYSQELAALYEPLFLRIFYESAVATDARYLEDMLGSDRVVEFGNRSAINDPMHYAATKSTYIGGGITGTSNDAAAAVHPQLHPSGTLAHRYFAAFDTEDEAMHNAVQQNKKIALLVDYADSYSGIDKVIALKQQYPDNTIIPRLDSGNMIDQVLYAIKQHIEHGMTNPTKDVIVVSDVSTVDDIYAIEQAVRQAGHDPQQRVKYGIGGLLVSRNKTRAAMSAAYKLTMLANQAKGKLSNTPAKEPTPGRINVEIRDQRRVIVQEEEPIQGERLLKKVVEQGKHLYDDNDIQAVDQARNRVLETFHTKDYPLEESALTQEIHESVRTAIQSNITHKETSSSWESEQDIYTGLQLSSVAAQQEHYKSEEGMFLDTPENHFLCIPEKYLYMRLLQTSDQTLQQFLTYPEKVGFGTTYGGHGSAGGKLFTKDFLQFQLTFSQENKKPLPGLTKTETTTLTNRIKKIIA